MKMIAALLTLSAAYSLSAGVTPVQKVIQMLQEMHAKGESEMEAEAKLFEVYQDWCKDTTRDREYSIQTAAASIERLQADIQSHSAAEMQLSDEIAELDGNIAVWEGDHKAATDLRAEDKAVYTETFNDYTESVDALGRAITVLKARQADVPQAQALLQKVAAATRLSTKVKALVRQARARFTPPEANAYESSSGGIVDTLKKLLSEFVEEKNTLEQEEMTSKHEYNMLALKLTDQIKQAEKERGEKAAAKNQHAADRASATGELTETEATKAEDEKYRAELISLQESKESAFASRQQLRGEELVALAKAIEIISGGAVSGAADKHLPALVQRSLALRGTSLSAPVKRVAALLQARGKALKSSALVQLAVKVAEDPLDKVRAMIRDLISKLQEEAGAEAEHKEWCDGELKTNKQTREAKQEQVEQLTATADRLGAEVSKLGQDIASLTSAMAELDAAMAEATEVRQKEKAENEATIADAVAAQEAVASALTVLKEFYAKAGDATALVQSKGPADDAPPTFDTAYKGQQGSTKGVVGMIEIIATDFARLEADTRSDEDVASKQYAQFSEETAKDKAQKYETRLNNSRLKTKREGELVDTQNDLKATQEELDSAMKYYGQLKPACLDAGVSYEERVQRRKEEIESLNEAWRILSGEEDE